MKILLLGDVHEDIEKLKEIIDSVNCDFILQTGDLGLYCGLTKPMYFIAGNHENWGMLNAMDKGRVKFNNLYHVKTAEIIKLTKNDEAVILSGINGNYSPKRYGMKIQDRERHFTKDDVERCKKLKNIDIFLGHEPPAGIGFTKRNKDVGVEPIKQILDRVGPKFFFFCHHHVFFEKSVGKTKIFGLGYAKKEYCVLDTEKDKIYRILLGGVCDARI